MTKTVHAYIVYDLDNWHLKFTFKKCLFGATNIEKSSHKLKWLYNVYGIGFDGKGVWNFGYDFARNISFFFFFFDNSSSPHADKNK